MKSILTILLLLIHSFAWADNPDEATVTKKVIIAGSFKTYDEAFHAVSEISKKSSLPFSSRGMVYNAKTGLAWPKNYPDELYAGTYYGRRSNADCGNESMSNCLSIERSEFYKGFTKNLYIIVAGIYDAVDKEESAQTINQLKLTVPDAYIKKTDIYVGCMH